MSRYLYMGAETITIDNIHLLINIESVIVLLSLAGTVWACFTKPSSNKQKIIIIYQMFLAIILFAFMWYLHDVKNDINVRMFMLEYYPVQLFVLWFPYFGIWISMYADKKKHH